MLTRVKDRLREEKRSKVVYWIPCDCGKFYIGETTRRLKTRLREHKEAHRKADKKTSAIAEHSWNTQHAIKWDETTIIDHAQRAKELKIKEALTTPSLRPAPQQGRGYGERFGATGLLAMKQMGGGADSTLTATSRTRVSFQDRHSYK